jgi:alpha-tubulin suppressor-like RCC1 family protein
LQVTKIFCGISQLGALTNSGHLYMWGRNKFGALGLGHRNDQFFPLKVDLLFNYYKIFFYFYNLSFTMINLIKIRFHQVSVGAQVQKLACGIDHTVSICKPFL